MQVKLFVLGRPGSGKSTVARLIEMFAKENGWSVYYINDYNFLQNMFLQEEKELAPPNERKVLPRELDGFDVFDFSVLDIVLEKLDKIDEEEVKKSIPKDELIVVVTESSATAKSNQCRVSRGTDPSLSKTFRSWLPTNEKNAFFSLIALIYLVFAAIHFCITGDSSMLTYLLVAVAGYAGVKGIESKMNQKKDKSDH
jgi:hypothetical protein